METIVRKHLGITLDFQQTMEKLRVPEDLDEEFRDIFDECVALADPKFCYARADVTQDETGTTIGGERFESRVMQVNFKGKDTAWPYVVTCGRELYDLAQGKDDPLEKFWVDGISEQYLYRAHGVALEEIRKAAGAEHLSSMNPGSLSDFPISQQGPLFRMLGDVKGEIGAWITESFLILPYKSGSGIYFATDEDYVNCALCQRVGCPNRRTPFDEMQFTMKYALDGKK